MKVKFEEIVERIITVNHAWKLSCEEFGNDFAATKSLRHTKSSLQATLLREFPDDTSLAVASDSAEQDEELYSVRLRKTLVVAGVERFDVEHLPMRIAQEIFTKEEINKFLSK